MNKVEYLVVHYSKSGFGDVPTIRKWHLANGWRDIGYSAVIYNGQLRSDSKFDATKDGIIVSGRGLNIDDVIDPTEAGAHTLGYNHKSIGVCLVADKAKNITANQWESLKIFCEFFERVVPKISIIGHREVNQTECPGFDVQMWLKNNKKSLRSVL